MRIASEPLDAIRQEAGLLPDGGVSLQAEASFTSFPPSLDDDLPLVGMRIPFRVRTTRETLAPEAVVPAWAVDDDRPLVFITFGTLSAGLPTGWKTPPAQLGRLVHHPILEARPDRAGV